MEYHGFNLDSFQVKAIQAIQNNYSILVAAPTGAGKTLIAEYALEKSLKENNRIIYTAPIKALSNQKFRDFSREYGNRIGILTGDVTINPDAQALIMTTEIFRNTVVDEPERFKDVSYVIFDEVHYLDDEERGTVWEESIIFAPEHIKIIALSATIPNLHTLAHWIRKVRGDNILVIEENHRPVPLKHLLFIEGYGIGNIKTMKKLESKSSGDETRFRRHEFKWQKDWKNSLLDYLVQNNQIPCLYFLFKRKDCEIRARDNIKLNLLNDAERTKVNQIFVELCQRYGLSLDDESVEFLSHLVNHGVAFHHAGMLPILKEIVEQLFTSGLIKLVFATETFAVGVNMPARSVVFDELAKFNGVRRTFLKAREYQQMAGRSGRRGMDEIGFVYSYIEKPYLKSSITERITTGTIEPVNSQFNLSYATLLNLYHTLKDKIYTVCEKSLSNFQRHTKKDAGSKHVKDIRLCFAETVEQVRCKLKLLSRFDYTRQGKLTRLGHFARQIYGSELLITELFRRGILERLNPDELNLLAAAVVFESRSREWYQKIPPEILRNVRKPVLEIDNYIYREEKRCNIIELSKEPDFKISATAYAWSKGTGFHELSNWTNAADGDLIRTFRRAIQVLHQVERAYQSIGITNTSALKEAIAKLKRDEVDAEKYLRIPDA